MTASLADLCAWAAGLSEGSVPADVLRTARLQHLALAGAWRRLRATKSGEACASAGGPAGPLSAFLLFSFDDYLLGGRVGGAAAPLAWEEARGSLSDLVVATVVANEVAARAGLVALLAHRPAEVDVRTMRVACAAMRAKLAGANAGDFTAAIEAALCGGGSVPAEAVASVEAAAAVAAGVLGGHGGGSFAENLGTEPLDAFGGAGRVWLTRSLVVPRFPGTPWGNVILDALDTILQRHLKAGEKRLRPDQVDRIEVRTAFAPAATEGAAAGFSSPALAGWSVAEAIGLMLPDHEFTPAHMEPGAAGEKAVDVADVAARVDLVHDWRLSVREGVACAALLGPALGEAGLLSVLRASKPLLLGRPAPASLWPMIQERPWEIVSGARRKGGLEACDFSAMDAGNAVACFPTEVKLYTTRGGWWPERRNAPTGTGASLETAARARFRDDARFDALLHASPAGDARDWIGSLLG